MLILNFNFLTKPLENLKQFFSILCLFMIMAFTSVQAYEKAPQQSFEQVYDVGAHADVTAIPVYTIEYMPDFPLNAILIKEAKDLVTPVQNPNEGLKFYSWEQDKRQAIRQNCRSNC